MTTCRRCKRDGNWAIECTDCLIEEIKNTASELQQIEAIKRELETMMAAELAREESQKSQATCIRCGEPRNIQNIPWCEKCLRDDGLKIPDQPRQEGKQRRWCSTHLRLENGPPWECFKQFNSFLEMHPSVERAANVAHAVKYQIPEGPATDKDKEFLESEIRRRFPK